MTFAPIEARFIQTAYAADDDLEVRIEEHRWPVIWSPLPGPGGLVFPNRGDLALVVLSNTSRAWVITWTPEVV